jgi:very-long-chain ceramide synthase
MSGLSKWYYLVQFAFWLQQIVVVNIEERRKDHVQMFTHHVITCTLIFTSYGYHQTKVGNLILCLMDVVDLFLPLAKILKYLKWRRSCDVAFGVFMLTWFLARHVGYLTVCYSVWRHIPQEIAYGCYAGGDLDLRGPMPVPAGWDYLALPFLDPVGLVCWNDGIKWVFLSLLLALQVVLLIWFTMICKVAYKVVSGEGADDTRSDDEDDEEDDEEEDEDEEDEPDQKSPAVNGQVVPKKKSLGKQVPSTDAEMRFGALAASSPVQRSSRTRRKADPSGVHTTGVHLLANSDRMELLGRIGCDKNS